MAESVRRAIAFAGVAIGAVVVTRAGAAEPPRAHAPATPPAHAATPPAASQASAADLELLEFLGSDDVEPDFQDYLANHAPAKAPAAGRSEKK